MNKTTVPGIPRDFYYYRRWTYEFPIGILVTILAVGLIILLLTAIGRRIVSASAKNSYKNFPWQVRFFLDGLRDVMLRTTGFLLFEFEHGKAGQEHKYLLYGVQVHLFVLQYLFVVLLTIMSVCVLTFWNTFLAESSADECDMRKDCFPIYRSNETPIQTVPITNCDDFPVSQNVSILCFELVYRYSEGLGEAGGFLFSMQVVSNVLIYIVIRMIRSVLKLVKISRHRSSHETSEEDSKRNVRCISITTKVISITLVLVIYCLVIVLLPLWLFHDRADFRATLQTPQRQLQVFLYSYTIFVLFLVPPIVGGGIYNIKLYDSIGIDLYIIQQDSTKTARESTRERQDSNSDDQASQHSSHSDENNSDMVANVYRNNKI